MGKKIKKTRWRTLTLNGNQSDSEESSTKSSFQPSKNYQQHKYSKFTFSSQSTPIRKYQHDSSKTTRSNSTTSDHKTTFNEDEYTRITTPRQDVLFKKGYLNKPKNYQTQTSTGTSSTANSTSTCTPDHQSADGTEGTDLEYESQFVFPNGFIDQNGIYYINSFEPFPFVVYNAPICYSEYPPSRTKRYSTDSMTESLSPQNEEINSELSYNGSGERLNNTPILNHSYLQPTCYEINGATTVECNSDEARKLKKKRRRKISRSKESSSESTTESDSSNEDENKQSSTLETDHPVNETTNGAVQSEESKPNTDDAQNLLLQSLIKNPDNDKEANAKYALKPDAEEFVPRTLRAPEAIPFDPNVQFLNFPPNFIPIPFVGELQRSSFLPPGIPLNFVPHQDPNFVNIVSNNPNYSSKSCDEQLDGQKVEIADSKSPETEVKKSQTAKEIDIAKIVSKLEEAAKQQQFNEKRQHLNRPPNKTRPSSIQRLRYNRNYQESINRHPENKYQRNTDKQNKQQSKFSFQDPPKEAKNPDITRVINNNVNSRIVENCSKSKDLKLETKVDCSDSLRKCKRYEQHNTESVEHKSQQKPKSPKSQNRWISVSSRKRRKNKSTNEEEQNVTEIEDQEETIQNDDLFESFDVDQLVDVVPEQHVEESVVPNETIEIVVIAKIEEELLSKEDPLKTTNKKTGDHKKKSKKGNQKATTKRIMITDPNLEQSKEDANLDALQEDIAVASPEIVEIQECPVTKEVQQTSENDTVTNTPEKKTKKKKKKVAKPTLTKIQSVSSSNTTLSNLDDSYDFLLENSILEDFEEKTNVEISQELDRMIQKGMYSNLEEKIKTLNIDGIDDGFFHAIGYNIPSSVVHEKSNTIKATDFGKILHNAAQILKEPQSCEKVDQSLIDLDFSSITLPDLESRPSTSKSGDFERDNEANSENRIYDNGQIKGEPQNSTVVLNTKNLTSSQNFSSHEVVPSEPQTGQVLLRSTPTNQDNMYPITTAVKDWMTRKRENSPDVKILKSPNTILKELELEIGNPRLNRSKSAETSPTDNKIGSRMSSLANDEEITLWSVSTRKSIDKDLDDIKEIKGSIQNDQNGQANGHIEEGEEAIETYESLYGKNQDFLKLKAEIEEQQKSRRFPRHGNLPYRAICCSIM